MIIIKIKNKENFIDKYNDDLIYEQYFNPYFIKPTNCMETIFGTYECYNIPNNIWSNNWWIY